MWNVVQLRREKDFFVAPIVDAEQSGNILRIAYANPEFYFKGTVNLILEDGKQQANGTFGLTLEDADVREVSIVGDVQQKPGLILFEGSWTSLAEPGRPWEFFVQYMPEEECNGECIAQQ